MKDRADEREGSGESLAPTLLSGAVCSPFLWPASPSLSFQGRLPPFPSGWNQGGREPYLLAWSGFGAIASV